MHYDVFNGDADGIFALHQLRLDDPKPDAALITGVKRNISLLKQIPQNSASSVTVLDVSLDKNRSELISLLSRGCKVLYIDHHFAGEIPEDKTLTHHIDHSARICTSLLANSLLGGKYPLWAACGAFGDNLDEQAEELAARAGASPSETKQLREMGVLFNYNGYGASDADLHFHPAELYRQLQGFTDPHTFWCKKDTIKILRDGYNKDLQKVLKMDNTSTQPPHRIYRLPNQSWARRMAGVFSNMKAREEKNGAHAILVTNTDGTYQVSVRAPLTHARNADTLCRQFPTGGGRAASAGINFLPPEMLDDFIQTFYATYSSSVESVT